MDEFERVSPWIEAALEYADGTHTLEDVRQLIASDRMFMVTNVNCVMVFEIQVYPQMKILHGFLCGGDLQEIKSFDPQLTALAKALGCKRITVAGRYGWARAIKDLGFKPICTVVSKEVQ